MIICEYRRAKTKPGTKESTHCLVHLSEISVDKAEVNGSG